MTFSEEGFQAAVEAFDLDEFQQIAARDILRDLEHYPAVPVDPDSEHERLLIRLGALVDNWGKKS